MSSTLPRRSLITGLAAASAAISRNGRKPNFVFLIADDHAGYVLGCDGDRQAHTPNLDRLAGEGVRFAAHYCNSPVCTPSRQSFLTGQMPSMAGVTVLRTPLSEDKPTLARQLKQAGYHTAVFGKMHFNRPSRPGLHGFDTLLLETGIAPAQAAEGKPRTVPPEIRTKPRWQPFRDPARIWLNADKLPYPAYDDDMKGTYIARKACQFLQERKDDPFALWVSFQEPHSPFDFPVEDRAQVDPARFPAPRVGPEDAWQIPLIFRDLPEAAKQGIIAAYYTSVSFLDRNIGRVLDRLRRLNLEQNTLVVYLADHGYSLGHHGRFEKHCGYDPALRVPLILRFPGRLRRGVVRDFTESIDVAPTILDLLGAEPLPIQHGQSLRPYLEGRRPEARRDHVFSQYLENEEAFIRTDRYKFIFCSGRRKRTDGYLIENPTPGRYIRLYDLRKDPGEFTDIARREPEVVAQMEKLLLDRFLRTHPEAQQLPRELSVEESIEWFVRPRDASL
ncbi:MAG: sulfatase-like hydrolase/transferase [Acidobacteria bacterium]|nr:sulfatase-like hydrolase/transferase [Acidobacteriota bacterium]